MFTSSICGHLGGVVEFMDVMLDESMTKLPVPFPFVFADGWLLKIPSRSHFSLEVNRARFSHSLCHFVVLAEFVARNCSLGWVYPSVARWFVRQVV